MNGKVRGTSLVLLLLSLSAPVSGQNYFMYTPHPASPVEKAVPKGNNGVLVREVEIRKGDTLFGISRRFSGRGSYYPQILLFNDLKNPHVLRDRTLLRVPVSNNEPTGKHTQAPAPLPAQRIKSKRTQSASEISLTDLKTNDINAVNKPARRVRGQKHRTADRSTRSQTASARKQYNQALASYRRENWRTALEQFDRFLASNPSSEMASDANLYKADCYLKLSNQ